MTHLRHHRRPRGSRQGFHPVIERRQEQSTSIIYGYNTTATTTPRSARPQHLGRHGRWQPLAQHGGVNPRQVGVVGDSHAAAQSSGASPVRPAMRSTAHDHGPRHGPQPRTRRHLKSTPCSRAATEMRCYPRQGPGRWSPEARQAPP